MSKTTERRNIKRDALIEKAEKSIADHGLAGLKMRNLASEIGVSLGAIYNLVEDVDALILHIASRTLAKLDAALNDPNATSSPNHSQNHSPNHCDTLIEIAMRYRIFVQNNLNLWRALFEHRMPPEKPLPQWATDDQMHLFRHIITPLRSLLPDADESEVQLSAQTLFSAVHGVIVLSLENKITAVPLHALDGQIKKLITLFCKGLIDPPPR